MIPAADWLTARLTRRPPPELGVFMPAGFPSPFADTEALHAFARRGAGILAIGIPYRDPWLDDPQVIAAHHRALRHDVRITDALETVRHLATTTWTSIVLVSYWAPVLSYGTDAFARDLAAAGAAGAMIVDLAPERAGPWTAAARRTGIHTPQLVSPNASDAGLVRTCDIASGWLYIRAANAPTSPHPHEPLDTEAVTQLAARLHRVSSLPLVAGLADPEAAAALSYQVSAVVIDTPVVRPLLDGGRHGLEQAADHVAEFSRVLRPSAARSAAP
ncbi:tryptophan synthase subunit alpha [Streptomyces sp. NPDC057654]|uniref:tryptophan synthase subunit alpha n=1 Tax=Streptomyces sp. NPDC057654 TaxID=3346196 RepID=UPI003694BB76